MLLVVVYLYLKVTQSKFKGFLNLMALTLLLAVYLLHITFCGQPSVSCHYAVRALILPCAEDSEIEVGVASFLFERSFISP